ncbi:MAG: FtsK/SpoIIIE domain-containing protein [Bdellovibrionales bacterium]
MSERKKGFDFELAVKRQKELTRVVTELLRGFERDIVPHHYIGAFALTIAILFWQSDGFFARTLPLLTKCAALVVVIFGGYIGWAIYRISLLRRFLANLTETFENAGLKTASGRLPSFILDREVDNNCRMMMLNSNKVPLSTFLAAKERLEAGFFGFIDKIEESRADGVVKIFYSEEDFPEVIDLDSPYGKPDFSFVIGNTRSGVKTVNFVDVPHILVAGSSSSGKSTFLKQVISTLYLNNADAEFVLIDLKFGLESIEFRDLPRMTIYRDNQSALKALIEIQNELKERGDLLYSFDCKNILEFNKKALAPSADEKRPTEVLRRKIVIVDEAAQIFLAGPDMTAGDVAQARGIVATLAAQGRALGINLIIGTQRPDVNIIDGAIKANMQGRVCFHMADNATSMTILDSARAADLPDIKGRAIYRNGPELIEVQVPQLEDEKIREIFNPLRVKPTPCSSQNRSESEEAKTSSSDIEKVTDLHEKA